MVVVVVVGDGDDGDDGDDAAAVFLLTTTHGEKWGVVRLMTEEEEFLRSLSP